MLMARSRTYFRSDGPPSYSSPDPSATRPQTARAGPRRAGPRLATCVGADAHSIDVIRMLPAESRREGSMIDCKQVAAFRKCFDIGPIRVCKQIALALAAAGWIAGAQAQELKIGLPAEPSAMDPHFHNLTPNNSLLRHIFDRLIDQNESQALVPGLAISWRNVD